MIFGAIRKHLGEILRELAEQKECQILEGHLMADHVHICISIPPKHSVSYVVGDIFYPLQNIVLYLAKDDSFFKACRLGCAAIE